MARPKLIDEPGVADLVVLHSDKARKAQLKSHLAIIKETTAAHAEAIEDKAVAKIIKAHGKAIADALKTPAEEE